MTGFSKTGLIASVHNCSYSPFSSAKSLFVDFLFSSKIQNMTFLLYVHTIIIPGELIKAKNKPLTPGNVPPRHGVLLGPHTWVHCGREIFTDALLLHSSLTAGRFLVLKTYPPTELREFWYQKLYR